MTELETGFVTAVQVYLLKAELMHPIYAFLRSAYLVLINQHKYFKVHRKAENSYLNGKCKPVLNTLYLFWVKGRANDEFA